VEALQADGEVMDRLLIFRARPIRTLRPLPVPEGFKRVEGQIETYGVLETIAEAARNLYMVEFTYTRNDGYTGTYEVEPYSVRAGFPGPNIYLFAYNPVKGRIHSFIVDRITAPRILEGQTFIPRWQVEF